MFPSDAARALPHLMIFHDDTLYFFLLASIVLPYKLAYS
jgi:hypothetical protein